MANSKEIRRERFERVAVARTNRAAEAIRSLGKCSNATAYDYTEADVKKIFSFLEAELKEARARFEKPEPEEKPAFTL